MYGTHAGTSGVTVLKNHHKQPLCSCLPFFLHIVIHFSRVTGHVKHSTEWRFS